jgi:hypothetical protein
MLKSQLLSIISKIRMGATSPTNISDSLEALATNPPYGGTAITTTLPTVLAQGEQIIYRDPNGVQSLWIGNADGEAWPSVGYKEYVALLTQVGTDAPVATVLNNSIGSLVWSRTNVGQYVLTSAVNAFLENKTIVFYPTIDQSSDNVALPKYLILRSSNAEIGLSVYTVDGDNIDDEIRPSVGYIQIRIYP